MELALNKLIVFVIMIVVLLLIFIFIAIPHSFLGPLSTQEKIRQCCSIYLANDCPDDVAASGIECPCRILYDPTGVPLGKECDGYLIDYLGELNWGVEQLKRFCHCT